MISFEINNGLFVLMIIWFSNRSTSMLFQKRAMRTKFDIYVFITEHVFLLLVDPIFHRLWFLS